MAQFTPEERECAVQGGTWDRGTQTCIVARPLPPALPLLPPSASSAGSIDPEQMFADGFVYVAGEWVRWDSPQARGVGQLAPGVAGGVKVLASVVASISSGSVLGYDVPAAAAVALPSFVGGAMGVIRMGGGMRPASGGTPVRIVMGPGSSVFPRIRMGATDWGR